MLKEDMGRKFRSKRVRAGRKKQAREREGEEKCKRIPKQWEKVRGYQNKLGKSDQNTSEAYFSAVQEQHKYNWNSC